MMVTDDETTDHGEAVIPMSQTPNPLSSGTQTVHSTWSAGAEDERSGTSSANGSDRMQSPRTVRAFDSQLSVPLE